MIRVMTGVCLSVSGVRVAVTTTSCISTESVSFRGTASSFPGVQNPRPVTPDRNSTVHNNAFFISLRSGVRFAKLTFLMKKSGKPVSETEKPEQFCTFAVQKTDMRIPDTSLKILLLLTVSLLAVACTRTADDFEVGGSMFRGTRKMSTGRRCCSMNSRISSLSRPLKEP